MLARIMLCFCIAAFCLPIPGAYAQTDVPQSLLNQLTERFDTYEPLSQIEAVHGNRAAFPSRDVPFRPGQELLVLKKAEDTPGYMAPRAAVIRVEHRIGNNVVARRVADLGQPMETGDVVVRPFSPLIFVHSNAADPQSFAPYQELLRKLLDHGFEVIELSEPRMPEKPLDKYGVLVRLEVTDSSLIGKVVSLYAGTTEFTSLSRLNKEVATSRPTGKQIHAPQPKKATTPAKTPSSPAQTEKTLSNGEQAEPQKQPRFASTKGTISSQEMRLDQPFYRLVICQLDGRKGLEFVCLGSSGIQAFHLQNGELVPFASYTWQQKGNTVGLHLHTQDLTKDGKAELIVTKGATVTVLDKPDTKINSRIFTFQNNQITPLIDEIPFYLRTIEDRSGQKILIGQKRGKYDPYTGDIYKLDWNSKTESLNVDTYPPAKNIYSLYQFNLIPKNRKKVMIIEPSNTITVYDTSTEKIIDISDANYGNYYYIPYKIKLEEPKFSKGGFEKQTSKNVYAERRFALKTKYDNQAFLIDKNRPTTRNLIKKTISLARGDRKDSIVAMKWESGKLRESWHSPEIQKDIIDFGFLNKDNEDELFVLVRDKQGYAIQALR